MEKILDRAIKIVIASAASGATAAAAGCGRLVAHRSGPDPKDRSG